MCKDEVLKQDNSIIKRQHLSVNQKWPNYGLDVLNITHAYRIANLISKLNFYKLIPYPMDNSLSGRRRPARQTSEKDVLCLH